MAVVRGRRRALDAVPRRPRAGATASAAGHRSRPRAVRARLPERGRRAVRGHRVVGVFRVSRLGREQQPRVGRARLVGTSRQRLSRPSRIVGPHRRRGGPRGEVLRLQPALAFRGVQRHERVRGVRRGEGLRRDVELVRRRDVYGVRERNLDGRLYGHRGRVRRRAIDTRSRRRGDDARGEGVESQKNRRAGLRADARLAFVPERHRALARRGVRHPSAGPVRVARARGGERDAAREPRASAVAPP